MALKGFEVFPSRDIPHHHLAITTSANDLIVLEPDGVHRALVSLKSSEEFQCASIPDTDQGVFGATDDMLVVDAEI